ncbi:MULTISPECIES: serine hydrolase [unclassified Streptomyces]|uniref:serine hydrolase n=1 Tax=unclassified Streptomyces TaxID=2593676 RepID=UPI000A501E55|nr:MULTISPECIES: serine hydrolase [unclassified Streptomyces]
MSPRRRSRPPKRRRSVLAAVLATALLTPVPATAADAGRLRGTGMATAADAGRLRGTGMATAADAGRLRGTGMATAADAGRPQGTAAATAATDAALCTTDRDRTLAGRMTQDIRAALAHRRGSVSLAMYDTRTHTVCRLANHRRYDAASVAKVLMMEATLRRAQERRRPLTAWERARVRPMITRSDNEAARRLWADLGHAYLKRFLRVAKTTRTTPGSYGYWGLTATTAADQLRLLGALAEDRGVLTARARAYGLRQMAAVRRDQRWGVTAGMPRGLRAHLKNGWLPRARHGWRVHSIGTFTGGGRTYRMAILSHGNPSMAYGVRTVERVAQAVHRNLHRGRAASQDFTPESEISEVPDGSAPAERPGGGPLT